MKKYVPKETERISCVFDLGRQRYGVITGHNVRILTNHNRILT